MHFEYLVNYDKLSYILHIIYTYISLAFLSWDVFKQLNPDKAPAGKGLTSWLSFVVSSVSLSLSHWYPGSGVVLDCIDS